MASPVRVAVFGNGFAARVQLPALALVGGNQVIGIAGRDGERARTTAERFGIPLGTDDWTELCALEPDLVLITTPVDLHAPMVQGVLETGAAILCEKPFTRNAAEAEPLVRAARGRLALIDHQLRWNPHRRRMHELVREGFVGDLWHVRVRATWGQPIHVTRPYSWWYDAERGGGILGAAASHVVDGVQELVGDVARVRARLATYVTERASDDGSQRVTADEHASLWLEFASGVRGTLEIDLIFPHRGFMLTEVAGSEGVLELRDEQQLFGARHGDELTAIAVEGGEYDTPDPELAKYGVFGRAEPLFLRDVLAAVRAGRSEVPGAATFEDGLACMRVLDAARASDANSTWVPSS